MRQVWKGSEGESVSDWKNRIIAMIRERNELVMFEDGFWYYWPNRNSQGALSMTDLRIIADHLQELNREWEEQIGRELMNSNPITEFPGE